MQRAPQANASSWEKQETPRNVLGREGEREVFESIDIEEMLLVRTREMIFRWERGGANGRRGG
jgi:hypothetical protein